MIRLLEFNTACFPGLAPLKAEPLLHFVLSAALHLQLEKALMRGNLKFPVAINFSPGCG